MLCCVQELMLEEIVAVLALRCLAASCQAPQEAKQMLSWVLAAPASLLVNLERNS